MTPSEAEKEFEEWISPIRNKMFIKEDSFYWAKQGYLEAHSRQQEKIDRLREGIQATLSYTLPYLAERTLKELLEEGKDERDGLSARCPICGVISNLRPDYGINESGTAVLHRLSYCGHLLEWRLKDET